MENEEVLKTIWAALIKAWEWFCGVVQTCVEKLLAEDVTYNPKAIFLMLVIVTIMLASGFWAASIAKSRRYNPILHFLIGCVSFFVYPIIILLAMNIKGSTDIVAASKPEDDESKLLEAMKAQEEAAAQAAKEAEEAANGDWSQAYFTRIARKADGTPAGPWHVVFAGTPIVVRQILEVLPDTVVTEIEAEDGETRKLRIRFNKIDSWTD